MPGQRFRRTLLLRRRGGGYKLSPTATRYAVDTDVAGMSEDEEKTAMTASPLPEDAASLQLQFDLERLDRQWLEEKDRYGASACGDIGGGWTRTGLGPVNPVLGIIAGIVGIALGVMWMRDPHPGHLGNSNRGLPFVLGGIATIAIAGAMLWGQCRNRKAYREAKHRYEGQRQALLKALAASKGQPAPQETS